MLPEYIDTLPGKERSGAEQETHATPPPNPGGSQRALIRPSYFSAGYRGNFSKPYTVERAFLRGNHPLPKT